MFRMAVGMYRHRKEVETVRLLGDEMYHYLMEVETVRLIGVKIVRLAEVVGMYHHRKEVV